MNPPTSSTTNDGAGVTTKWQWLILVVASWFTPVIVWVNSTERADVRGFLLIGSVVFVVAAFSRWGMSRFGLDRLGATYATAAGVLAISNGGLALDGGLPRWVLAVASIGVAVMAYLLKGFTPFRLGVTWLMIVLGSYPIVVFATTRAETSELRIQDPPPLAGSMVGETRDLVIIVLDAYANPRTLEKLYDIDLSSFERRMNGLDFLVEHDTTAGYGRTRFSVSSVMQMDYPVTSGSLSGADLDHLLEVLGGENRLFAWLQGQGYETTYVESGWYGTKCAVSVDNCVESGWPDESFYDVTYRSLLRDLPGFETGLSFARGAQRTMTWLANDLGDILRDNKRDVIYAHVLAPHPPLFMNENCDVEAQSGFKGFTIYQPGMTTQVLAVARAAYARQVTCVNEMLLKVAESADATDSMVVMFGDHGPDSLGQLFVPGADWDDAQRFERLSSFVATRVPGCEMASPDGLVNVSRRLMSCISTNDLPDLAVETYEGRPTAQGEEIVEVPRPHFDAES